MALFLRDEDVTRILTMDDMIAVIEDMHRQYGLGRAYNIARRHVTLADGGFYLMGGGLLYGNVYGQKSITLSSGGHSIHVTLTDATTGRLLAFLQAGSLGQLRTGATTALAVKYLSRSSSSVVGVIGTGDQAPSQLEAVCRVRNVSSAKVYSRNLQNSGEFARKMEPIVKTTVEATKTNREAVEGSDIVVCIASNVLPVVEGAWLSPGTLVVGAGTIVSTAQELDQQAILNCDKIFVDSIEQASYEAGDLTLAVKAGLMEWSEVAELCHVIADVVPGRQSEEETIYVKHMGIGLADVAAAKFAYEKAVEKGVGIEMEF